MAKKSKISDYERRMTELRKQEMEATRIRHAAVLEAINEQQRKWLEREKKLAERPPLSVMVLGRNKAGEFYFRQPMGQADEESIVTWHIYLKGESLLQDAGLHEGDSLPAKFSLCFAIEATCTPMLSESHPRHPALSSHNQLGLPLGSHLRQFGGSRP